MVQKNRGNHLCSFFNFLKIWLSISASRIQIQIFHAILFFLRLYISWSWIKIISSIRLGHLKGIGSKVSLWICVHCPVQFLQERGGGCRNDFGINSILNKQKCTFALSLKIGNVCLFMDAVEGFDTSRPAQYPVFCYCFTTKFLECNEWVFV